MLDKAHERLYMQETCGSDFSGNFVPCVCRRQLILMYVYEHMYIYICIYIRIYDICVCAIFNLLTLFIYLSVCLTLCKPWFEGMAQCYFQLTVNAASGCNRHLNDSGPEHL